MDKKQYTKYETRRTARPRSERLKALGAAGTVAVGSSLGGVSALRSALDAHIVNAAVHVTAAEREAWNLVASLFGVDENGDVKVKGGRGLWSESFMSSRGSDPLAGSAGGAGLDEDALWDILSASGKEKIDISHIPSLSLTDVTGLEEALASKLSGITGQMVKDALGYTPYDAAAVSSASVAYAASSGTAGRVAHALTVKHDGGSSSAADKAFDGGAAVTVTIPTTLPASDVYAWAKAATKPSYTWGEIGGKPTEFTPAEHTHVKADITDFPTSWAWSAITGTPTTLAGYGIKDGVNEAKASGGLSASVSGHVLTVGVASGYAMPTSAQIGAWNAVAALFGVDADGNVYVKDGKGFYGMSFVSSRGSDPEAGQIGTGGLDEDAMWEALASSGSEKIDASHIPSLSQLSGTLTNAQLASDSVSIAGVEVALGGSVTAAQIASALTAAGYKLTDTTYGLATSTTAGLVRTGYLATVTGGSTKVNMAVNLDSLGRMYVTADATYIGGILTAAGYKLTDTVATLESLGITATAAELNKLDGLATTAAELGYVHGVTSAIQTQLNGKQATVTGAASTITANNLTVNRALVSNASGKVAVSAVTSTELGYLDGVTSNIQTQLNAKANASALASYLPLAGGTMTGDINARNIEIPTGSYIYSVMGESGGAMVGFVNGHTQLGSIGASSTSATHIRSITGHATIGAGADPTYNILDSGNYTSYTVTKTGGGASGTWGISISGTANKADYLLSEYTGSGGTQPPSYFNGKGLKVNMMNKPVAYTDVIVVNGYNGIGADVPYINAIGFRKTAGDHGDVYHARGDYGGDAWGTWHKFLDSFNYTNYTVSRDIAVCSIGVSGTSLLAYTYNGGTRSSVSQAQLRTMLGLGSNAYTSTAYLPLAGGTLTGTLFLNTIGTSSYNEGVRINRIGSDKWASITIGGAANSTSGTSIGTWLLGASPSNNNYNFVISENGSGNSNGLTLGGNGSSTFTWKGNEIWHAGNDGSGSGLDADLLDGKNATSFMWSADLGNSTDFNTATQSGAYRYGTGNLNNPGYDYGQMLVLHGGGDTIAQIAVNYSDSRVMVRAGNPADVGGAGSWTDWKTIAFTTSNVASATKLATARTLWGQTFDGTGNVDGSITVTSGYVYLKGGWFQNNVSGQGLYNSAVDARWCAGANGWAADKMINAQAGLSTTTINASSHVSVGQYGNLSLAASSVGLMIDSSFRNLSWTINTSGGWARSLRATDPTGDTVLMNVAGIYGSAQTPNYVYLGGTSYTNAPFVVTYAGNVGVGTTAPSFKLSVVGTGNFTGRLFAQGGVTIGSTDDIGWYLNSSRLTAGTNVARGVNVGNLLVSNAWADYTKVPTNGIYSKGPVLTDGYLQVGSGRLRWDSTNNALYVEKSDGTACGLYSKGFMSSRGSDTEAGQAVSGGGLDEDMMWDLLAGTTTEKINASHLPTATTSAYGVVKAGIRMPGAVIGTYTDVPVFLNSNGQMYIRLTSSTIQNLIG